MGDKYLTVKELKSLIADLNDEDIVYAYSAETTGIVVVSTTETGGHGIFKGSFWKENAFFKTLEPEGPPT